MKKFIGLLLLTTGLIFLLSNTGVIDTEATSIFSTFWPALIVLYGLKLFFEGFIYFIHSLRRDKWHFGKCIWGALVTAVGMIILGNNAGWFIFSLSDLWSWAWPILVVYIGLKILFGRGDIVINFDRDNDVMGTDGKKNESSDTIIKNRGKWKRRRGYKYHQFIGDIQLGKQPFELDNSDISMGIGSIELDLTKAILKDGENILDVRGWIGDVEILVPKEMAVKANVDVRIGDVTLFDDKYSGTSRSATYMSTNFHDSEKKLLLFVNLNIGSVEVLTVD